MGKSFRSNQPVTALDFFNNTESISDPFAKATAKETVRQGNFSAGDYENADKASYYDSKQGLDSVNKNKQTFTDVGINTAKQFGANVVSSFGQGLANSFDFVALAKTAKAMVTGSDDNFESHLFGLSTKDMQDWANGIAQRNQIYEKEEGAFNPLDMGWWGKQIASSGTGMGMGLEAIASTAAIELATGGMGTGAALVKLGNLGKRIVQGARGAEVLTEALQAAKGLRSAATLYGVISRASESRMEAMGNYDEIYKELSSQKKDDGTEKYSEDQKKQIASEGARRTFYGNMALLPLDIIGFRTMVYNPISGAGEGLIERTLGKIAHKGVRTGVQFGVEAGLEGLEEGGQFVFGDEGKHYARVLAGTDDGSNFLQRLGRDVSQDEFWNNVAGGVIGSPVIAGGMKLVGKISGNNRAATLNEVHKDFVQNVGKMDAAIAERIKDLQSQGKDKEASILRRQFSASKALSALHLDAMSDKESGFESHINFLKGTLEELNNGKTDVLTDLGFNNLAPEHIETIKEEFKSYLADAQEMKGIYDEVKHKYNRNYVPEIADDHFHLNKLTQAQQEVETNLLAKQGSLHQYNQLSAQGKEIYNAEYQLKALEEEAKRLNESHRKAESTFEKTDIANLIEANKTKLTQAAQRLEQVQADENYTDEAKSLDNDILGSALRSTEYLQAQYDKIRLDNEISLKRKEIARWNNSDYIEQKDKESIAKAKTAAQVKATKENLDKNGKNTASTQAAITEKEASLAASEAANDIQQSKEASKTQVVPGDANLFDDNSGNNFINDIKSTINTNAVPVDEEYSVQPIQDVELLNPNEYDFDKSSDEAKEKIKLGVSGLLSKIGDNSSFEDLVRFVVNAQGRETADNIFNALKYGWKANGKADVDFQAVYNKVFANPMEQLMEGVGGLVMATAQQAETEVTKIEQEELPKQEAPVAFTPENQPVYTYKGRVTNEASPKAAFVTRASRVITETDNDGNVTISREYTEEGFSDRNKDIVDSDVLLDPDSFNEGTQTEIRIPDNVNDVIISVFNPDGSYKASMTFGKYVAENNLTPDMQEYQDKVPMVHYAKGYDKGVFFVHDVQWYNNPANFNAEQKDDLANAIANTRRIRAKVLENHAAGKGTPAFITGKRQTTFNGLKLPKGQTISLKEANPDTKLAICTDGQDIYVSKRVPFANNTRQLINGKSPFVQGTIYDVRRFGTKDGVATHVALPVIDVKLDAASKTTVAQAIAIYANRGQLNDAQKAVVSQIQNTMGLDILSPAGLESYLSHFIYTLNAGVRTNSSSNLTEAIAKAAASTLQQGTPYIAFEKGQIIFGQAGMKATATSPAFFINPNSPTTAPKNAARLTAPIKINGVQHESFLDWFRQNVSLDNLSRNKPVVTIDGNFNATVSSPNYNDFLISRLHTNVKSHNIGTEEKPNYVTNIQPVITYDLAETANEESHVPTVEEIKQEIIAKTEVNESKETTQTGNEVINQENSTQVSQDLSQIEKEALDRAKSLLGRNLNLDINADELYEPAEMSDSQREEATKDITRIAGLTPDQQMTVVNFMYNQIVPLIDANGGTITKSAADKQVEEAFNKVVLTVRSTYADEIKRNEELIAQHPSLKDSGIPVANANYQLMIDKIDAVKSEIAKLKELAYARVEKFTGIKQDSEKLEEDEENAAEETANQKEKDFWTDILTESPDNRLTYAMRRFFGQIRSRDKKGELVTGFLGLPLYEDANVVSATLMTTLADVPSDFNTMIAKLEERKEAIPWLSEVIARLKAADNQKKNQFVTVMSNHSLRMKFTMISFNQKNKTWTTKVFNTNQSGVAAAIKDQWENNLINTDLVIGNEDGTYSINLERAKYMLAKFEGWKGLHLQTVSDPNLLADIRERITKTQGVIFTPSGVLAQELKSKLVKESDRLKFSLKGFDYQVRKTGDKYIAEYLNNNAATDEEVQGWLANFGISLSPSAFKELKEQGLYHNYTKNNYAALFNDGTRTNGLFGILYNKLKYIVEKGGSILEEEGTSPLEDSVIKSLASLESKYNSTTTPFGFRDGKKTIFALTAPKFITDRVRDLKGKEDKVRKQLEQISFSKGSFWLGLMQDETFREKFEVAHMGLTAFKQLGKKSYKDNGLTKLSDLDHELTKLGMFWDTTQGEVRYTKGDVTLSEYPDTSLKLRMATMFSPTMSDKHLMTLITTAVLNLGNNELNSGKGINKEVTKVLYEQVVRPELLRMVNHARKGGKTNISAYDKGAAMFMFMPHLNNLEYKAGLKLVDAIKNEPNVFTIEEIENNSDLIDSIYEQINKYVQSLTEEKIEAWKDNGLLPADLNASDLKFFDKKYMDKFRGTNEEKVSMAAMDFVVNSMVANSNSFMTMAGDPAIYYKSKATDPVQKAKDTFVNVGKRLANQIAPGTPLANAEGEQYIQLFLEDRVSVAENIDYLERLLGEKGAAAYRKIEGADAQEYTTWKEHLDILAKLGKIGDNLTDITPEEVQEARELFSSNKDLNQLTERQQQLVGKVMQPIKPVYTGQIFDAEQDVMRTVYIKSSSFPLIPQLTAGMEIDKLRVAMEKMQNDKKMNVRASYQTANKVGSVNNAAKVWNEDGTINEEILSGLDEASLMLDRKNFRIQQEVPFKSGKNKEDKITLGTQIMKLLFGDEMLEIEDFTYNGKTISGKDLHQIYNDLFINLVNEKKKQLFSELGLNENGTPIDAIKSMAKFQTILKKEAINRGYPLQDIQGLTLNANGEFNLPLWSSANSNRYESMLNAIVSNRLIKMKFPGNSYVVGSEEGFRTQDNLDNVDQSKIIWTSSWNGKELQGSLTENGELKKAQVLVASKFRDNKGVLVDLFTKENGEYKYITKTDKGTFLLKEEMFDKDLLSLTSFRIPSSGHQSASQIEIVGFLPHQSADLMIVPKGFTKQKGLDFDVDKENTYQLHHYLDKDGKFKVFSEEDRNEVLLEADKEVRGILDGKSSEDKFLKALFGGDIPYTKQEIADSKFLSDISSKVDEKLMHNEIIKIHAAILSHPSDKVQAKISKVLSTDYAEEQADFIEKLTAGEANQYWTPLSDEYQKSKMALGAGGKIGTGAYSLDVVFHSLAQQAKLTGKPINLVEWVGEGDSKEVMPKTWKFGNIESFSQLGSTTTADRGRSISEVMAERQNIAVDNEKLQVMGRVGLDDLTMDVDKVFNMVGLDKGEDGNSISFLFLSQPIIREFVSKMKNSSSNVSEFMQDKEGTITKELLEKYFPEGLQEGEDMSASMTNENFIAAIQAEKPEGKLQAAVLLRFLEMKKYGIAIRGIQTSINTDSKGLGKSFFDVIEKRAALNRLGNDTELISGASNLIGEYIPVRATTLENIKLMEQEGYINIGNYMVKPTSLSGGFSIHGVMTAYNLWSKHFPYDAQVTAEIFKEVLPIIGNDNLSDSKSIELKQQVFQGIRRYAAAHKANGIIQGHDNISEERRRLYIDSDENTSLATYIKGLLQTTDNAAVNTFIKTNKLINRFEFDIQKNGQPSLIKFNNAAGEEFDEQYLYESLATLMEIRGKNGRVTLPKIGNKQYTLDTLAQDLIAYAYLGNSVQEAIQFTKYVPVSYLNTVGFAKNMRSLSYDLQANTNNMLGINIKGDENKHMVSDFTMQFVQHNPERVKYKLEKDKMANKIIKIDEHNFQLKGQDNPIFISVYDSSIPKGEKKFKLYWFDGKKYTQIPVLGTFGMDEYQPSTTPAQSLVNGRVKITAQPQASINGDKGSISGEGTTSFGVGKENAQAILHNIAESNSTPYTELVKRLLPFVGNIKVVVSDELVPFGKYLPSTNTIEVNAGILDKPNRLAGTVIHEVLHSITFNHVNQHITANEDGTVDVKAGAPVHITNLVRLYNTLRSTVDADKLASIAKQVKETGLLSKEDKQKYYGYINIHEFITMSLTDWEFQKQLNAIPYKQTGQSLLDKFKEFVANVLTAVGVKFDPNYSAAHAISTIFEVIEQGNQKTEVQDDFDPFQSHFDDTMGDNWGQFDDEGQSQEGEQLDVAEFPNKQLTILSENCL